MKRWAYLFIFIFFLPGPNLGDGLSQMCETWTKHFRMTWNLKPIKNFLKNFPPSGGFIMTEPRFLRVSGARFAIFYLVAPKRLEISKNGIARYKWQPFRKRTVKIPNKSARE